METWTKTQREAERFPVDSSSGWPAMELVTWLPWKKCEWIESAIGDIVSTQEETEFSIRKVFLFKKKFKKKIFWAEIRETKFEIFWRISNIGPNSKAKFELFHEFFKSDTSVLHKLVVFRLGLYLTAGGGQKTNRESIISREYKVYLTKRKAQQRWKTNDDRLPF